MYRIKYFKYILNVGFNHIISYLNIFFDGFEVAVYLEQTTR